jgi:hypothetical protein
VAPVVWRIPVPVTVVVPPTVARAMTGPVPVAALTDAVPVAWPEVGGGTAALPVAGPAEVFAAFEDFDFVPPAGEPVAWDVGPE